MIWSTEMMNLQALVWLDEDFYMVFLDSGF